MLPRGFAPNPAPAHAVALVSWPSFRGVHNAGDFAARTLAASLNVAVALAARELSAVLAGHSARGAPARAVDGAGGAVAGDVAATTGARDVAARAGVAVERARAAGAGVVAGRAEVAVEHAAAGGAVSRAAAAEALDEAASGRAVVPARLGRSQPEGREHRRNAEGALGNERRDEESSERRRAR